MSPMRTAESAMVGSKGQRGMDLCLSRQTPQIGFNPKSKDTNWDRLRIRHNAQSLCAYETVCAWPTLASATSSHMKSGSATNTAWTLPSPVTDRLPKPSRPRDRNWFGFTSFLRDCIITPSMYQLHRSTFTLDNKHCNVFLRIRHSISISAMDTNIMSILVAIGPHSIRSTPTPRTTHHSHTTLVVSHVAPFAARLDIEVIDAPQPVSANRSSGIYEKGR